MNLHPKLRDWCYDRLQNYQSCGGSRGGSQGAMEPPFHSRLSTATVARLQLASQLIVIELYLHTCYCDVSTVKSLLHLDRAQWCSQREGFWGLSPPAPPLPTTALYSRGSRRGFVGSDELPESRLTRNINTC